MFTIRRKLVYSFLFSLTFVFFSLFFSHHSLAQQSHRKTIRVGIYDNPPQNYRSSEQEVVGIFPDLLKVIAREENWDIEYVFASWEQCLNNLETGDIDLMIDIAYSKEREKRFHFSKENVVIDWATVYTKGDFPAESLLDLQRKTVAVVKEDIHKNGEHGILALAEKFNLNLKYLEVESYIDVLNAVETDKVDAGIVNRMFGARMEKTFKLKPSPIIFNPVHLKFAYSKNNEMSQVVESIDRHINEMKQTSGSIFYKIINSYLAGAEYDLSDYHDISPFKITKEEQAWLRTHPRIRLGINPDFPPYSFLDERGNYQGIAVDTINFVAKYLGIDLVLNPKLSWQETINNVENKSIDAVLTTSKAENLDKYLTFTDIYLPTPLVIIAKGDEHQIEGPEDLAQKKVCLIKNQDTTKKILQATPSIIPILVNTPVEGLQAVSLGQADCCIGELGVNYYQLRKNGISNLKIVSRYDMLMSGQAVGVRKDWPEFASILTKALNAILERKKIQLYHKWISNGLHCEGFTDLQEENALTQEETEWVKNHQNIRLGIDPEFAPFEFLDSKGQYQGIVSEYIHILNKRLGLDMKIVPNLTWKEAVQKTREGDVDVLPCVAETTERKEFLNFSVPYLNFNRVIIARTGSPYIRSIESIKDLQIAVQQETSHEAYVKEQRGLQRQTYPTIIDCLKAVSNREADVMIGDLASTMFWIRKEHLLNLKIAGLIKSPADQLHFGSRKDWPEFTRIINKGLASISPNKHKKIHEKWVHVKINPALNPQNFTNVIKALVIILIILSVFTCWIFLLIKEIQRRKKIEDSLKARLDLEELLSEIATSFININIDEIDNAIRKALRKILFHLSADSGYIFSFIDDKKRLQLSHYWNKQRQLPSAINKTILDAKDFPPKICTGDPAVFCQEDFNESDIQHPVIKDILHEQEVIIVPIPYGNELAGMLWITSRESRKGRRQELPLLKTIGFLFGNTLHRIEIENQLAERRNVLERKVQDRTDSLVKSSQQLLQEISNRKKDLEEKEQLQVQLLQAQKLESIGTLAGGIAHDFNNILSAILGFTELAQDNIQPDNQQMAGYLARIYEGGLRAKSLVQQILTFSRQTNGKPEIVNPVELVNEAIQMLRPSLPTTIDILTTLDDQTCNIFIDPTQFNQILMNLCTNAFHAMEENGGILSIHLSNITVNDGTQNRQPATSENYVQLIISDTGPGIAEEIKGKIFDPYFTTKKAGKGTGMGLSIVHGIITNCGGSLKLESSSEKGSKFSVLFPARDEKVQQYVEQQSFPVTNEKHILFVDDEKSILQFNSERLKRMGYRVTTCNSGREALHVFKQRHNDFDLVITDQTMAGMTGAELSQNLLQIRPNLPIILCTGYSSIIDREKAKKMGIKGFTMKPVSTQDLSRLIRKVLDQ